MWWLCQALLPTFKQPEVRMMLVALCCYGSSTPRSIFALLETLGKSDDMYQEFFDIQAMMEKHEYLTDFNMKLHMIWQRQWQYIVDLQKEYSYLVVLRFFLTTLDIT